MRPPSLSSLRTSSLRPLLLLLLACVCGISGDGLAASRSPSAATTPKPVPDAVRQQFHLAPFYQKYVDVGGLPIVGSSKVSDDALKECAWIVQHMLEKRPDILQALGKTGVRFAVMAYNEYTTDIPEHSTLQPQVYWDRRARGLGATQERPAVSCAEENLLAYPGDPYPTENIGIHEFAHAIHEMGLREVDPAFDGQLRQAYENARKRGLWTGTYAAVNRSEYWAEAVQSWFDNNRENDALHNHVNTRAELKAYDPAVAALCERVFGDIPWRYQKPAERSPEDRAHLTGFDPANAPHFQWRNVPTPDQPRVMLQCADGEIELQLDGKITPERVVTFLNAVHQGYYSDGQLQCAPGALQFAPAAKLPSGEPVPAGEGRYEIIVSEQDSDVLSPNSLRARITKGGAVMLKLTKSGEDEDQPRSIPIQRVVRLN